MVYITSFRGLRPRKDIAKQVSAQPYDVLTRAEVKAISSANKYSILHVTRCDAAFKETCQYDEKVYYKSKENLDNFIHEGILIEDESPVLYIYKETYNGHSQTGIVATVPVSEYKNNRILKHELTRNEKEIDRIKHFKTCNCQTEPVFLTYRSNKILSGIISDYIDTKHPEYDFISDDTIRHQLWIIDETDKISQIIDCFNHIDQLYIADGHHRTESVVKVCDEINLDSVSIMSVIVPDNELSILPYNRIIYTDLDFDKKSFYNYLNEFFFYKEESNQIYPHSKHEFGLMIDNHWFRLVLKNDIINSNRLIENLDVSIMQKIVFEGFFNIFDPKKDTRIDFIGGTPNCEEINNYVKNKNFLYITFNPISIESIMSIADNNMIMPPKSTWFEPKLRSGLFLNIFR